MIKSWEKPYDRTENRGLSIETFRKFIEDNFELLWDYRFFYRETVALLNAEPDVCLDEVLTIVWIVANHYLVHLESMGQVVDYHDFENGTELILKVLHPYMI